MRKISLCLVTGILVSASSVSAGSYTDNGDGSITDNVTTLMWEKQYHARTWEDAINYCQNLALAGYSDWRLPNVNELSSLVDMSKSYPRLDTTYLIYYPDTMTMFPVEHYWSSTTCAFFTTDAFYVSFSSGSTQSADKINNLGVRCVRQGQ